MYVEQKETRSCAYDVVPSPVECITCCRLEDKRVMYVKQEGTI